MCHGVSDVGEFIDPGIGNVRNVRTHMCSIIAVKVGPINTMPDVISRSTFCRNSAWVVYDVEKVLTAPSRPD